LENLNAFPGNAGVPPAWIKNDRERDAGAPRGAISSNF